jgi:hypothetical protein
VTPAVGRGGAVFADVLEDWSALQAWAWTGIWNVGGMRYEVQLRAGVNPGPAGRGEHHAL